MGQNIELREQIGVLSADMTLHQGVGSDGLSYWVKSKLNPNDRLAALLAREVKNDIGDMLDCVVSGISLVQINEKRALQLPALNDTLSFQSALENASEFNQRLFLARSLATFVQELHNNNVVAGGLDPNSLFYYPGEDKFVTINSWNLAIDGEHSPGLISDLQDYSNLVSISPEATGRTGRKPDKSSDLYSLGVLLYKVFTGEFPFDNDDPVALVHAHIARAHEFDPGLAYSIPEVILAIIDKLLDKEPEKRYPDIESLVRDLNEGISQLTETGGIRSFPIAKKSENSRITFPEFLYGREAEVAHINELYLNFLENQNTQLISISGASGIGKSALINELRLPVTEHDGLFAFAKCDQFNQSANYSVMIQALRSLLEQYLLLDESALAPLRRQFSLLPEGHLSRILPVLPELQTILGDVHVATSGRKEKLEKACFELLDLLTRQGRNIVLVLDDLQWIDKLSVEILSYFVSQPRLPLLFGTFLYRDTEVTPGHSLQQLFDELEASNFSLEFIRLDTLSEQSTQDLVEDTFWETDFDLEDLGAIVIEKTQGNPFFVKEFLQNVASHKYLFENEDSVWSWQEDKIRGTNVTENVIDLIAVRLARLPEKETECLKFAAHLDHDIDVSLLQNLLQWPENSLQQQLQSWVSDGIAVAVPKSDGQTKYYFSHNKVRQAARQLETGQCANDICYQIAKGLLSFQTEQWLHENALELVQYLHPGLEIHKTEQDTDELARYYLLAGNTARTKLAKEVALDYFRSGASLVTDDTWKLSYELAFELYEGLAESLFECQIEDEFEQVLSLLQHRVSSSFHSIKLVILRVKLAIFLEQFQKAHELCIDFIVQSYPEVELPESIKEYLTIQSSYPEVLCCESHPLDAKVHPEIVLVKELLAEVIPTSKSLGNIPYYQVVYINLWLSFNFGDNALSARGYANHALILAAVKDKFVDATKFIELAERCHEHYAGAPNVTSELNFIKYTSIIHWTSPIRNCTQPLYENYQMSLEYTGLEFVWDSLVFSCIYQFLDGEDLETVVDSFNSAESELRNKEQIFYYNFLGIWQQLIQNLTSVEHGAAILEGDYFDRNSDLPRLLASNSPETLFAFHFCCLQLCFYFGNTKQGIKHWNAGKSLVNNISPYFHVTDFYAFGGLLLVREYKALQQKSAKEETLSQLQNVVQYFHSWSGQCPANQRGKLALLQAELAAVLDEADSWKHYTRACSEVQDTTGGHWRAIIHQCFADYWLEHNEITLAESHYKKALSVYKTWGASAVNNHLQRKWSAFAISENDLKDEDTPISGAMPEKNLDLLSVLKAAETLSGSIDLEAFLARMMNIIVENAGAQRGCIIFDEEGLFKVRGSFPDAISLEMIPDTLLNYVVRTKQPYVVDDAALEAKLNLGLKSFGRLPQSLLITPLIVASRLRGLLYLEHRDLKGFFTEDRIGVLQLLANQTAILFDNASLNQRLIINNRDLEIKVEQRTEELASAKLKAEEATAAKSNFLANMSHEIRTPMNAVIGLSRLALRKQVNLEQRDYLEKILNSSESLLTLINDILDFSKIEAQKLTLEAIPFSLEESLRRVVNLNNHKIHEKHLEFVLSVDGNIPDSLIGDPMRIEQIIINLVSNAIKFTEQGYIHLNLSLLSREDDELFIEIRVRDSGIGMSEEQSSRLFSSFSQADETVTRKYGGTGLGLAICKQLSELMGGTISVASRPGDGSEFVVQLFVQESSEHVARVNLLDVSNIKALVVDDVEIARNVMCDTLDALGIVSDAVASGDEALELVSAAEKREQPYNIILMDWKMPGMDGIEATKRIRDMVKGDIPHILMITAYDKEEIKENHAAEVVDRFIEKPVSQSALIDGIQSALGVKKHSTTNVFAQGDVPILNGARILLVEDNELNQQVAMEFLLDTGVSIELATDGLMALQAAQSISFDLILMDIQMPEMDGLQATREIRKFDTTTPIVAMTAHAMEGDRDRSLEAGMNAHITKPIEPAELYNILSSHILQGVHHKEVKTGPISRDIAQEGATSFGVQVLKQINALNVPKAIERFQGRSNLYIDLVDDFLREYADIASDLVAAQHDQNTDLFYRKVHSLKSNAAYIGAFELSDMLSELEARLQNTQDIDELFPTILAQVKDLLKQLIEKQELRKKHDDEMCLNTEDKSASLTLTTLLPLLQNSDFKVEAKIAGLKENINCEETLEMLGILENLVDEMEFEEASDYLKNWIKEHPQDEINNGNGS